MKNAIESIAIRLDLAEENICETEDRTLKLSTQRKTIKKKWKGVKKAYFIYEIYQKDQFMTRWSSGEKRKKGKRKLI